MTVPRYLMSAIRRDARPATAAALLVLVPGAILLVGILLALWLVCPAKVERAMRGPFECPRGR